jgi:UDP-N-acetylglucosamine 2-epimerase (non-hydrolysing)
MSERDDRRAGSVPPARRRPPSCRRLGIVGPYAVLTLHRPSNVDGAIALERMLRAVAKAARRLPIVFPVHPRTRDRLDATGLATLTRLPGLHATPPLGYLDMLALLDRAELVLTDSGGVQEETTYLGVPCLTLRAGTERPATVTDGTNRMVGTRPERVLTEIERVLDGDRPLPRRPPLWDGRAAERVADVLAAIGS